MDIWRRILEGARESNSRATGRGLWQSCVNDTWYLVNDYIIRQYFCRVLVRVKDLIAGLAGITFFRGAVSIESNTVVEHHNKQCFLREEDRSR